jgi:uncharacterized protein (DUF433 family)
MLTLLNATKTGCGVYTASEAARYAKIPIATLNAWFFGTRNRLPLRSAMIQDDTAKVITFVEFVEALAIRALRIDYKISLQKIREAINTAKNEYGIDHPFAHQNHKTVLINQDLHIFVDRNDGHPTGLTGKDKGQKSLKPCIEAYMKNLEFGEDGLASLYTAFTHKDTHVVLKPSMQFGQPVVAETGYSAETLWRAAVIEGDFDRAAEVYEVTPEAVEAAYRYCNSELGMAA